MLRGLFKKRDPILPAGRRVYAVGDVHGRLDLFRALLNKLADDNRQRDAADVQLILLGDLIDRGPKSREVVALAREGLDWARTVAIMGNHEAVMLEALDGDTDTLGDWLRFGGRETLLSWGVPEAILNDGTREDILDAFRRALTPAERSWLGRMRTHIRHGDYYFVHAGVRPDVPLDRQQDEDRLWIREEFLESRRAHGAMIVHGHSIREQVEERSNRIGIDTGAYKTGRLTAIGLEADRRWFLQTDADA